ncbi:hypothetical protein TNCV_2222591 [Trichonephila clavipes]|nr:hypothetical protein TNCV_2222591 [Trichonephila clavipes]
MNVGVQGLKPLKSNTLQPLLEQSWLKAGILWSDECFPGMVWVHSHHCERNNGTIQISTCNCGPPPHLYAHCFPQNGGISQLVIAKCQTAVSARAWFEEHQDKFSIYLT